jgi:outer membrane protein assembly factor BamB
MRIPTLVLAGLGLLSTTQAGDWPRFRGSAANGVSSEKDWLGAWPGGQPRQVWKGSIGAGFSAPVVAGGRVYATGHNGRKDDGEDRVVCLDAGTGKELWRHVYAQPLADHYYEGGTSATPTLDGDRLYTLAKSGLVHCLDAATGAVVWKTELATGIGAKVPEWGFAGAPHVHGNQVILNAGDAGIALDKATGKTTWIHGKGPSGYGSPVPFSAGGKEALALFGFQHVIAVDPTTGRELWRHPWKTKYDVNAADPVVAGDLMFLSSGYGTGGTTIRFTASSASEVWKNKAIRAHMQAPVVLDGFLYAIDGDGGSGDSRLKCVELATGRLAWESPKAETGVLSAADGKILWVTGRGELVVLKANPAKYEEVVRAQVTGGKVWTAPVLSNGRLYVRNWKGDLLCLDVKGSGGVS